MKFIKFLIVAFVAVVSSLDATAQIAAARRMANEFTLVGEIKGAGNAKVVLEKLNTPGEYASVVAKDGKFTFLKCKGTTPYPFKLTIGDKSMLIMLENGRITMKGDINDLQNAVVENPSTHRDLMTLLGEFAKCKSDTEKDYAMEAFMSKNSHSWLSLFCLEELAKKYSDNTQKMRGLLGYVAHFAPTKVYMDIEKAVAKIEAEEEE